MDETVRQFAINAQGAIQQAAIEAGQGIASVLEVMQSPHVLMKPRVFLEKPGVWCAMYGECLGDSPAGFGDSPWAACADFDRRWNWSQAQIDKCEASKKK